MNIQLLIRPVSGSGAAGHYGEMFRMNNISHSTCMLKGFPGLALLDAKFNTLPTHLTWSTTIAGNHPVTPVSLAPGHSAYFLLYWPEIPTGNEACPSAPYMMITPPNDRLPDVTYSSTNIAIHPCGGRIATSPVVSTPFNF